MTKADKIYRKLIKKIQTKGELISSRNGMTRRHCQLPTIKFHSTPLVTLRKTAIMKALEEMEWFLSGDSKCPPSLYDWWGDQLSPDGHYFCGYGSQLIHYTNDHYNGFNQIEALIDGLTNHPFSRRHVITTWNPADMADITKINSNEKTPTTCHTTIAQFFVSRDGGLLMHSYQRSADMLLGVPHNWIQSWALLLWLAAQIDSYADTMLWTFGDAHIYQEESHLEVANKIITHKVRVCDFPPKLNYTAKAGKPFNVTDFELIGKPHDPITTIRPVLL